MRAVCSRTFRLERVTGRDVLSALHRAQNEQYGEYNDSSMRNGFTIDRLAIVCPQLQAALTAGVYSTPSTSFAGAMCNHSMQWQLKDRTGVCVCV